MVDNDGGCFVVDLLGYLIKVKGIDYEINKVYIIVVMVRDNGMVLLEVGFGLRIFLYICGDYNLLFFI